MIFSSESSADIPLTTLIDELELFLFPEDETLLIESSGSATLPFNVDVPDDSSRIIIESDPVAVLELLLTGIVKFSSPTYRSFSFSLSVCLFFSDTRLEVSKKAASSDIFICVTNLAKLLIASEQSSLPFNCSTNNETLYHRQYDNERQGIQFHKRTRGITQFEVRFIKRI